MPNRYYGVENLTGRYNNHNAKYPQPGSNGIQGFKTWECYMLLKYGKPGTFGLGGQYEYLIEMPIYPEDVTEQLQPQWSSESILGRSSPISAFAGVDLKSVNFSLELHRDLLTGSFSHTATTLRNVGGNERYGQYAGYQEQTSGGPFDTRSWYTSMNKMLQAACYPQYTDNGLIPPITYFVFGQMILKGYITSYSTTWQKPIINTFYSHNRVDLNMACFPDSVISAQSIIEGPGAASTQNTFNTVFPSKATEKSNVMNRGYQRSNNRNNSLGGNPMETSY